MDEQKNDRSFYEDVLDEMPLTGDDASERLAALNNSRLSYVYDPLKRLQSMELALLVSAALIGLFAILQWNIAMYIMIANTVVVGYKYFVDRRRYEKKHGKL